ncbi:MAG: hypothetical protein HYZ79_02150, partial [Candidatus Melainabacteria bacterium]|nr:hypothetical protein [Candidatus Melainabacteria bacterium]
MKTFVGLFFVFIFSYFHVLPANCQAMDGPPAGTLPPPCIVQVGQPPCTAAEIGNCWADISTGAAEPIFKICTTAGFVEIEKTIHDLPTTFKNTVTIDTTGTLTNNAITTLNGATTVAGATTLSGPTTTISSMTTDITGTANLTGPTIISGTTTLSGSTTTISSMTTDISSNTTHTGTTDFNNTVNLGAGIDFLVGSSGNLNFGANRLQNIDTPVLNDDAVRKDYVDTLGGGLAV